MNSSPENEKKRSVFDVHARNTHEHKRRNSIKDIIYGRNVLNLKPRFRIRHPGLWIVAIGVVVGGIFLGIHQLFTKADVQDFYPSTCLGNWQNSANAENDPETLGSASTSFSDSNSAVYVPGTQIFCTGFLPPNVATSGQITNVGLTLVWQVGEPPVATTTQGASSDSDSDSSSDSSTVGDVSSTDNSSDTDVSVPADSTSDPTPAPADIPAPTPPPAVTSSSDDGTSFIRQLIPFAFAQDDTNSAAATSDITSTIILGPPIMASLGSSSSDPAATTTGSSSEPIAVPPPPPDDNFLDVSYSTDGQNWISVGEVNINNWQQFTVTLPISNWNDLQNLQIRVEGIPTTQDPIPPIYLDGMLLEVHYDTTALLNPDPTQATSTDENTSSSAIVSPAGSRMTLVNAGALQTCDIQPFSQPLPLGGTATFMVNLHPSINGVSYSLLTGHLPLGISAGFGSPSGQIAATSSLTFQAETSTIPGSLNIAVIYQEDEADGTSLSNFCQLNIDVN